MSECLSQIMRTRDVVIGMSFGELVVIGCPTGCKPLRMVVVRCSCGTEKTVIVRNLVRIIRPTISCGCKWFQTRSRAKRTHGMSGTSTYNTWRAMMRRCYDPRSNRYHIYGGRGITVCERWHNFNNFLADMGISQNGLSLDRYPNNNGNYEYDNCRWATPLQQGQNSRRAKLNIEKAREIRALKGTQKACVIARLYGVGSSNIRRIWKGYAWKESAVQETLI